VHFCNERIKDKEPMCVSQIPKLLLMTQIVVLFTGINLNAKNVAINATGAVSKTVSVLDVSSIGKRLFGVCFFEHTELQGWVGHVNSKPTFAAPGTFQVRVLGIDLVLSFSSTISFNEGLRITTDGYLGILPGKLFPVLVKAVHEQHAFLDGSAKELALFKKKVNQLNNLL
jgi:hypothetical protein